ncbi:MAG: pitrilysin family protein [Bryobacter sp.]
MANGLEIVTEKMPSVRSVAVGIWIASGSRLESGKERGIAHFLEHMLFKGTPSRNAEQIARAMDSIGGQLDAFTAKEMVSYNTKVVDEHLPIAWDVLSDMLLNPLFDESELEKEKGVILEELKMEFDNPEYQAHELFTKGVWKNHGLGQSIIGTRKTIQEFDRGMLVDYHDRIYGPANMVVTAAGSLEHEEVVKLVESRLGSLPPGKKLPKLKAPSLAAPLQFKNKRLQQAHVYLGAPSYPIGHEKRFVVYVLNTILGGGMSSRLFQNIRERQGLAYAVMSELMAYRDNGYMAVYAGTSPQSVRRVVESVMEEFRSLKQELVSQEELRRAKEYLKGSLLLSLESTNSRMSNLARQQMFFGRFATMEELIASVESVTAEEVQELANENFQPEKLSLTVLGKTDGQEFGREVLAC